MEPILRDLTEAARTSLYWLSALVLLLVWYVLTLGLSHIFWGAGQDPIVAVKRGALLSGVIAALVGTLGGFFFLFHNLTAAISLGLVTALLIWLVMLLVERGGKG